MDPMTAPIEYYSQQKPSFTMGFLKFVLRYVLRSNRTALRRFTSGKIYKEADTPAPTPRLNGKAIALSVAQVQGRQVFTLQARQAALQPARKVVLYLHGGAYVNSFAPQHWFLMQQLVKETGYPVVAPDYALAPLHTYPEVFALVEAVYQELAAQYGAQNVLLMGDSAGGGLALALTEKLKQAHLALPGQLVLLSPWLDAALENPGIAPVAPLDPMLTTDWLRLAAMAYAGTTPLSQYQLSPINGDLTGLPRTSVFIGTSDIFVADARKFKQVMTQLGNPINYFEYNGAIHVWMVTKTPEGKQARQQIIDLLKS
jgi:epsilon-lactone hydrolase